MVKNKSKLIKQQLEDVQNLIVENLYLQAKYPDSKLELELGLESLRELESVMIEALKQQKLNQKLEVSMGEYGKFKRILEDYNRRIINETDPIKKQELITLKTAFLWENKCMYRIYKGIHNIDEECLKEAVSNLTEKDIKDAIDNVVYDSKIKENKGLIEKIGKLLNE